MIQIEASQLMQEVEVHFVVCFCTYIMGEDLLVFISTYFLMEIHASVKSSCVTSSLLLAPCDLGLLC